MAYHWSGGSLPWGRAEDAWDPVALYRKVLAEAEDESVTIASIGFFENVSFVHTFYMRTHSLVQVPICVCIFIFYLLLVY